jgi:hypothetical protein
MNTTQPIQIFKPGTHTAMSGVELAFSESDLQASAAAYDPAKHEAPLVVGHPRHDGPAYGWVKSLAYADGLEAEPHQVDDQFAEMLRFGRYKKISASFYTPDSPQNPVPGVYYLRHVGFLGAQPPAVKGLRAPEFADNEQGVVEFGDYDDMVNAGMWRRMRDWIIGRFGLDEADKVIPDYNVATLEDAARQEDNDDESAAAPGFAEPSNATAGASPADFTEKGDVMSAEDKARLDALEAENKRLKDEAAARDRAARHSAHTDFAEGLVKEGRLVPAQRDVAVAMLDFVANQETVVEFGEGDGRKPLLDAVKGLLSANAKQVEFSEIGGDKSGANTVEFSAAPGYSVDTANLEIHQKAVAYQEAHKVDYVTAVKAVGGQ